jgi:hypothetical protein
MSNWKGIVGKGFTASEFETYVHGIELGEWKPEFIVLHNTSEPRISQWHTTPGAQRMINLQSYYRDQQGWSAGPHLFVADDLIWVFTPLTVPGVHAPSWNEVSWGVEMVGEYEDEPFDFGSGAVVRDNAVSALATLSVKAGLDSHSLRLHKEDPRTTHKECPGKNVDKADMIQRVHDEIGRRPT